MSWIALVFIWVKNHRRNVADTFVHIHSRLCVFGSAGFDGLYAVLEKILHVLLLADLEPRHQSVFKVQSDHVSPILGVVCGLPVSCQVLQHCQLLRQREPSGAI